ncbi:hypothetical protein HGO37_22865 [Rhizobium sp. CG4]|uniref:hypothetical protein n=1 Tax=Rhizobium sp. CG4 TaxID=2726075 RepID=UPI00203488A7|nr:hypothetical protein [Rhizobium sp. CG4]MCM2458241.1 hypothetical protein [Rhizobium sp. CG4]
MAQIIYSIHKVTGSPFQSTKTENPQVESILNKSVLAMLMITAFKSTGFQPLKVVIDDGTPALRQACVATFAITWSLILTSHRLARSVF